MSTLDDTLQKMADRAQRHLDGMTINRDAMAKDVLQLVEAVRVARACRVAPDANSSEQPRHKGNGFTRGFDGVFEDIFKTK